MSDKKKMPLAVKFHLLLVLPLFVVSALVTVVTQLGLEQNALHLTSALRIQAKANEVLPLLLVQDDASKAILIDPDRLDEFSEKKVEAYDAHKEILEELQKEVKTEEMRSIIRELFEIDEKKLRDIDTKILEQTFDDIELARKTYFNEYEPERQRYEGLIRKLAVLGQEDAALANQEMMAKNRWSVLQIVAALLLGIAVVSITIIVLSRQIERSERNMKSLLDGLTEGLFFFDRKGEVAPERSQALSSILPNSRSCGSIQEMATTFTQASASSVDACLGLLWQDEDDGFMSDFETSVSMLPSEATIDKDGDSRNLTFEYREIKDSDGNLDKVITIVEDVTERLKNEKEARLQAERVRKVSKAASNLESFEKFLSEAISIFKSADAEFGKSPDQVDDKQLKRDLHTLKGSIGTYEFTSLAKEIHELEDLVGEIGLSDSSGTCQKKWETIKDQWKFETSDIEEVLGLKENRGKVSVQSEKLDAIHKFAEDTNNGRLEEMLQGLTRYRLRVVFEKYESYVEKLASRREDKQVRFSYVEDSDEIGYGELATIDGALIHIFRNCLDHGIEADFVRADAGKPTCGNIQIACYRRPNGSLHYVIKDDGAGIDGDKLAAKAVKNGLWTAEQADKASDQDKIELIFAANLSTKEVVTEVSGRGVGMDAVRSVIQQLGGQITVFSQLGIGTQFEIDVPVRAETLQTAA